MPDTNILPSPWSEELKMDAEINAAFERVHEKLDDISKTMTSHLVVYAGEHAATKAEVNGVGQRLNDHIAEHAKAGDKRWAVWLALISAAILWLWEIVKSIAGKKLAP